MNGRPAAGSPSALVHAPVQGSTLARGMPNAGEMAQLSRPYQIALGALVVLALAWFVVLHRPGSSSSTPEPASPAASTKAPAQAAAKSTATSAKASSSSPGASTPVYNGAVPGLHGLTRDIARAHGAVTTSEANAKQLR